ncbi:cytochrome P450 [Paenibacillus chitinolyticus]|uniref:cytochrome P450 n=1 Tax=Paenibacillus chitinolyticus TaxID=79263 RepID=UPI001C47C4B8|nr:cytochrome P450 [Paenibacillus chitinolyticus]MBV6715392.1 cytochrome P450 [Paenibacillus chitinolyticus]
MRSEATPLVIDYMSTEFRQDPWPLYTALRQEEPIHWSEKQQCYFLSKFKHIKQILLDTENFTVEHPFRTTRHLFGSTIIDMDGKKHSERRPIMSNQFKPSAMQKGMEDAVRQVIKRIVDGIPSGREVDFIQEVAIPIPMTIIMEAIGLPAEDAMWVYHKMRPIILHLDNPKSHFQAALEASDELYAYIENFVRGGTSRGMIAHFRAAVEKGQWTQEDMNRHILLLLSAGSETTACSIANIMAILLDKPEQLARVMEDGEYLKSAVQESLRWQPPLHTTTRICKKDYELDGVVIPKGKFVILLLASANRDEEMYDNPAQWIPSRKEKANLSFSMGSHNCLGFNLAKLELEETFLQLFNRFSGVKLAQKERPVIQGQTFRIPQKLLLTFS